LPAIRENRLRPARGSGYIEPISRLRSAIPRPIRLFSHFEDRVMATVKDLLSVKDPHIHSIGPNASVREAAQVMNEHRIGALVVLEAGRLCGMFTERDILRRVVAQCRDPEHTPVHEVMTTDVICCTPQMSIEDARSVMKDRRIRHLPVLEQDRLRGLVSIGDLNAYMTTTQERQIHFLERYISGQV
jgi:CBS domain-containing protein